jgi:hypothetical protein
VGAQGFDTYLVEDLTKAVAPASAAKMREALQRAAVKVVQASAVANILAPTKVGGLRKFLAFGTISGLLTCHPPRGVPVRAHGVAY